jgi:proteasome alpha subunit
VTMPFYVSPEQAMRDKADYARKGVARGRSCVALQYAGGILLVAPNSSSALHKISELYDRIGFAAVGRYNEYEMLRKAGVTYADVTGYQYDRDDVTARGIANWYAQNLGTIFTDSNKPFEVEIVVAQVGEEPEGDQIYRITFDGSVTDEPGFVAFGGQADQVAAALKDRFSLGMSLSDALGAALAALTSGSGGTGNGDAGQLSADQLEVAILDRARAHRTFRRLRGARLEELLAESRGGGADGPSASGGPSSGGQEAPPTGPSAPSTGPSAPPTGPADPPTGPADPPTGPADPPTGPRPGSSDGTPPPRPPAED